MMLILLFVLTLATNPAAGTIAFQSDRDGRDKIYLLDVASREVRPLTHGPDHRDEEPAWSRDGTRLAFSTTRFDPKTYDIGVMAADGSGVIRVTDHAAPDQDPDWFPDGQSLVFTSEREGTGAIYRVWLADKRVERLSRTRDRAIMPAVSPDGRHVAYTVGTPRGFQIFVLDVQTGQERQLTRADEGACRPAWSRDGTRIAYVKLPPRAPSTLEVVAVASGEVQPLAAPAGLWSYYPTGTPADGPVAFSVSPAHHDGEDWDIALVDKASPEGFRRLTSGRGNDRVPAWKP